MSTTKRRQLAVELYGEEVGCGAALCVFGRPVGLATNGPCACRKEARTITMLSHMVDAALERAAPDSVPTVRNDGTTLPPAYSWDDSGFILYRHTEPVGYLVARAVNETVMMFGQWCDGLESEPFPVRWAGAGDARRWLTRRAWTKEEA